MRPGRPPLYLRLGASGQSVPILDSRQRAVRAGWGRAGRWRWGVELPGGPATQGVELVEVVEAGDKQAGVDGASHDR